MSMPSVYYSRKYHRRSKQTLRIQVTHLLCTILSYRNSVLLYSLLSSFTFSCRIVSYPITSYHLRSYPILSYRMLSFPTSSYLNLSYEIVSYSKQYCSVLSLYSTAPEQHCTCAVLCCKYYTALNLYIIVLYCTCSIQYCAELCYTVFILIL